MDQEVEEILDDDNPLKRKRRNSFKEFCKLGSVVIASKVADGSQRDSQQDSQRDGKRSKKSQRRTTAAAVTPKPAALDEFDIFNKILPDEDANDPI
ncbi:hypothetical protein H2199_002699 [Coniosporium tulheliwenetii]|uniref:Uncharacterized protein n=1 Tax=Coniosporium tulheliwenetii TaxID=3383036 RepID=A0ACC2ZFR1_9PEZI|nr:hypothetical protein H2199_002699 [Cladosporium sp. JES 115]